MSLSIPSTLLVHGASRLVGEVAQTIGQAVGFADVLADSSDQPQQASPQELREKLLKTVENVIRDAGFTLNQPLSLSVREDGRVRVRSHGSQAGEIERTLQQSEEVRQLAKQLAKSETGGAGAPASIDLTIPAATATILPSPGGYPNW